MADGDQTLLIVSPALKDIVVGAVREVHHLALRIDDVVRDGRLSADREQVAGLQRGASAHRRVDAGVDERRRVGLLAVDHGGHGVALQIGVRRAVDAAGGDEQARETENGEELHCGSFVKLRWFLGFRPLRIPGRLPQAPV